MCKKVPKQRVYLGHFMGNEILLCSVSASLLCCCYVFPSFLCALICEFVLLLRAVPPADIMSNLMLLRIIL